MLPLTPTNLNDEIDIDKEWNDTIKYHVQCLGIAYVNWLIHTSENSIHDHDQKLYGNSELQDHRRF